MADPRRRTRPAVEVLEGRALLAGSTSPTSPVPIHPEPITKPTNKELGAAYRQIVAIQESTLHGIGAAHRRLYAAYGQLANRVDPAIASDRRILTQGADLTLSTEDGLVIARGIEERDASTDKIYVTQGLYTTLGSLVQEAQTTGKDLVRSAGRGTDAAIQELNALGRRLS